MIKKENDLEELKEKKTMKKTGKKENDYIKEKKERRKTGKNKEMNEGKKNCTVIWIMM